MNTLEKIKNLRLSALAEEKKPESAPAKTWPAIRDEVMLELPEGTFLGQVIDIQGESISVDLGDGDLVEVTREQIARADVDESLIERAETEEDLMPILDKLVRQDLLKI